MTCSFTVTFDLTDEDLRTLRQLYPQLVTLVGCRLSLEDILSLIIGFHLEAHFKESLYSLISYLQRHPPISR